MAFVRMTRWGKGRLGLSGLSLAAAGLLAQVGTTAAVAAPVVPPPTATTINLVPKGTYVNNGDGQGTNFYTTEVQPTGTGVIKPFLTIQRNGKEHGYNTDAPIESGFDMKRQSNWTRSLELSEIAPVSMTVNGVASQYIKFLLDINESNSTAQRLLSLNVLQLFVTDDQNLTGYTGYTSYNSPNFTLGQPGDGFGAKATKVYDLDKLRDYTVELNYDNAHGSGSGDLYVYVPFSVIAGRSEKYLTLYSSFGDPNTSSSGFEEWSVVTKSSPSIVAVPLPGTAAAGLALLGGIAFGRRRLGRVSVGPSATSA